MKVNSINGPVVIRIDFRHTMLTAITYQEIDAIVNHNEAIANRIMAVDTAGSDTFVVRISFEKGILPNVVDDDIVASAWLTTVVKLLAAVNTSFGWSASYRND